MAEQSHFSLPQIKETMEKCLELVGQSTCNSYKVGAVVLLQSGIEIPGSSGSKKEPCTKKGVDYCTRYTMQYCDSFCGEGDAMINTYFSDHKIRGATLVSTSFPCSRCKDLVLFFGIEELIFLSYKHGAQRPHEKLYAIQMMQEGVRLKQFIGENGGSNIADVVISESIESIERKSMESGRESFAKVLSNTESNLLYFKRLFGSAKELSDVESIRSIQ